MCLGSSVTHIWGQPTGSEVALIVTVHGAITVDGRQRKALIGGTP